MMLWQGFFRKFAKTTQKTTKFTTWRRFIWATFALTKLFNCLRLLLYVQIQSPNAAKNKAPSDDGALFFATFGDGAKKIFFAPLLCLGALPLLYPAAPPSVFAFGKYTAPAVALGREYVVGFWVVMVWIYLDERRRVALLGPHRVWGLSFWHCLWIFNPLAERLTAAAIYA